MAMLSKPPFSSIPPIAVCYAADELAMRLPDMAKEVCLGLKFQGGASLIAGELSRMRDLDVFSKATWTVKCFCALFCGADEAGVPFPSAVRECFPVRVDEAVVAIASVTGEPTGNGVGVECNSPQRVMLSNMLS